MMRNLRHQTGFTLIELLLVIMLMSSMAMLASVFVDNAGQQMGFDQTKSRLEQIRRAIIGDTSRTINGQPELSGFVADMGRLPESLSELIEPQSSPLWNAEPIPGGELYGGWRGPYLDAMPESSGTRAFRDGWGNQYEDSVEDGENYGWVFTKEVNDPATTDIDESARIFVQSLGADFGAGQADVANLYHQDYPAAGQNLIHENDWRINLRNQPFKVQINRFTTDVHTLQLQIFSLKDLPDPTVTVSLGNTTSGVTSQEISGIFPDEDKFLPMGTHAAIVLCIPPLSIPPAPQEPPHPYDGDCLSAGTVPQPKFFKVIPRAHQTLQFEWNTQ